jgi:hypothetical protein
MHLFQGVEREQTLLGIALNHLNNHRDKLMEISDGNISWKSTILKHDLQKMSRQLTSGKR